ncbi:MAG: ornithine carbamoyltransferase [Thermoanaerobacterales bacterium]|nr:ornithine carbamoyltransferase [Thermoanaerobacterales bacterium]
MQKLRGRDFLGIADLTGEEIRFLLEIAKRLKEDLKIGRQHELLRGKSLAGIFETPSTRTSCSFETAMTHLGGHMMWLDHSRLWVGDAAEEDWHDTIKTITRYVAGFAHRPITRDRLETGAQYADVPYINASCPVEHPTQALADLLTMQEKKGDIRGCKVAFLWGYMVANPPAGLTNSTMLAAAKLGFNVTIACPEGFDPDMNIKADAEKEAELTGGKIEIVRSYEEAVKDADFINIYSWVSPEVFAKGLETNFAGDPEFQAQKDKLKDEWCVRQEIVEKAKKDVNVMHCLPVARNEVATDEVLNSPASVILDEAENRLHTIKSVLAALLGGV